MPDAIAKMTFDLKRISNNIYNFFEKKIIDATIKLSNDEFSELINGLQNEVKKAFELNVKCIVLGENWKQVPTLCEFLYANYLKIDLENNNINDFSLMETLKDQAFYIEFIHFTHLDEGQLYNYSNLYEWVKHHIWYIVIHQ
ncbi:unnamed protein product [Rhizophagus irregularis]|nr:unnamed protein product [Rhizophagus irregularis]